ncbi:MAG TPA: hypothetical protein VF610_02465, partial [Segetibacter sp.]
AAFFMEDRRAFNYIYSFSFARWQTTSSEKLKAKAKATASQYERLVTRATIIITRQKILTTTVRAFFSDRYFFISQF